MPSVPVSVAVAAREEMLTIGFTMFRDFVAVFTKETNTLDGSLVSTLVKTVKKKNRYGEIGVDRSDQWDGVFKP